MAWEVDTVLAELTLDEKIALLSGIDFWHTAPVHRLGVPSIRLSDGPNGVRGTRFFNGVPAACLPCGTCLGATWDKSLVQEAGALQGAEAIAKGASVILGPTVNMQRSPLGGRGFESFSEDPILAGTLGASTVCGIQSTGVQATIKHYVCNDQEHERQCQDSRVSERALREIYLMPFMIVQRDSQPGCAMTAYNRVNGVHASESAKLLQDVLRKEWGFSGLVMSDWFGTYTTADAIRAGLDLEMPGPSYIRGELVKQALGARKLLPHDIDACVRNVLNLVKKVEPLGIPENAPETTVDSPETAQLLRNVAGSGIVLMKNEHHVLPFSKEKSVAVIGPNAAFAAYCGGGSASLLPYYAITPLAGIKKKAKDVRYRVGAVGWKNLPLMSGLTKTKEGKEGLTMRVYLDPPETTDREQVDEVYVSKTECFLVDYKHPKLTSALYWVELEGTMTSEETAEYRFSLSVAGTGKVFIDNNLVVDNETAQRPGDTFFGAGTREEFGSMQMQAGRPYKILVKFGTAPTMTFITASATNLGAGGLRVGAEKVIDPKEELAAAVKLAQAVDQVIICAGLSSEWESEGYDRDNMHLPPMSDELITAVTAVNPNTAVVIQSGTPVTMPWLSQTNALLQAWYGGNETGNAIADVLFGDINPSGKLPLSFPHRVEDNPAFLNYRSERGRTLYGEDVYIGYRFYEKTKKDVAFPFGHGLSYSQFEMKDLEIKDAGDEVVASVSVTNTGRVDGAEVVQVYVNQRSPSINRPPKELKGFEKVFLKAGENKQVEVNFPKKYAASFWDEDQDSWIMERDTYEVLVGNSSAHTPLKGTFEVRQTSWWNGL
ncbi:beta-glucosidase [Coniosporium apollinis]|uniref:beta-glucosidase n=1 Tax=Coniosporium apollinis TaxID=61459 RepID=A0ABQ9NJE1_9PEZI|nr:beta-glucosidase [Coniosporium apollinis]